MAAGGGQKWESEVRINWDHFLTIASLLDPLNAPQGPKKASTVDLGVECTVEKAVQGGSRGIRGLGAVLPGAGLALHAALSGAPLPSLSLSLPRANVSPHVERCPPLRAVVSPRYPSLLNRLLSDFAVRDAILFVFPSDTISLESFWSRELYRGCRLQESCA